MPITIHPEAILICVRGQLQRGLVHIAESMLNDAVILCADSGEPVPEMISEPLRMISEGNPKTALALVEKYLGGAA